jgi:hypothetical protein
MDGARCGIGRPRAAAGVIPAEPPLTPDGDEAREQAERVLSRPEFAAAEPTPLDRIAQAIGDALEALFGAQAPAGLGPAILVGIAVVAIGLIVAAFAIWGRPRMSARSRTAGAGLFDGDEARSAASLRAEAEESAASGDYDTAVILRLRALARATLERGVVDLAPGATVHAFARAATRAFPTLAGDLDAAADAFDDVRYLRRPATAALYERVARADREVAAARPTLVSMTEAASGAPR